MIKKSAKSYEGSWEDFLSTLCYLHHPVQLQEPKNSARDFLGDAENIILSLLSRALEENGLPEEVVAVQLVTRNIGNKADFPYPLMIRDGLPDDQRNRLLCAFIYMTLGLKKRGNSIHLRMRGKARSSSRYLKSGVRIIYPAYNDKIPKGKEQLRDGVHEVRLEFKTRHSSYRSACIEKFGKFSDLVNGYAHPGVKWHKIRFSDQIDDQIDDSIEAARHLAPEWKLTTHKKTRLPTSNTAIDETEEGGTLKELALEVEQDDDYRALVAPLHACGPIIVCLPKVYNVPPELKSISGSNNWVFDAGLTVILEPTTKLLSNPSLRARIMLVAERIAGRVTALTGLLPHDIEASRRTMVREAFGLVGHSLGNAMATLESTDPQVARVLYLEQMAIDAAAELAGEAEMGRDYTWAGFPKNLDGHFAETLARGIIEPKVRRRGLNPEKFNLQCSLSPIEQISPKFATLLIEMCRNLCKHHDSLDKYTGSLIVDRSDSGKITVISRTLARKSDAEALCKQTRWNGGGLRGLRLLFELARSLSAGKNPSITVKVPSDFFSSHPIGHSISIENCGASFYTPNAKEPLGWCEIHIKKLNLI